MSTETESIGRGPLIIMVKVEDSALLEGLIGGDTIMVDSIIIVITEEDKYIKNNILQITFQAI
jgi:hypothetical protein